MRAKFYVQYMQDTTCKISDPNDPNTLIDKEVVNIRMFAVYANKDGSRNNENSRYWNATPGGQLDLFVINKEAVEGMEVGQEYYIDFTKAE